MCAGSPARTRNEGLMAAANAPSYLTRRARSRVWRVRLSLGGRPRSGIRAIEPQPGGPSDGESEEAPKGERIRQRRRGKAEAQGQGLRGRAREAPYRAGQTSGVGEAQGAQGRH